MYSKTIYKKDSKGKLRFLTVKVEGADVVQLSGIDGTDSPTEHRSTAKAKNVGRSNETTAEQQAELEAKAKVKKKLEKEYFETIDETMNTTVVLPMLADDYKKHGKKIDWSKPVFAQPKLDGMRSLGNCKLSISRDNKELHTIAHIRKELEDRNVIDFFDGEIYAHGLSFQENMRLVKKYREGETEQLKFHVYDMVYQDRPFFERYKILMGLTQYMDHITVVPTFPIQNEEDLKRIHQKFLSEGYEGTIVRHGDTGYEINHRSKSLLKYKDFIDIAAKIVDVKPSDKNPKQGIFICESPNPVRPGAISTFGCGMKYSHKEREEILANMQNYIGKTAEVRFFEYSDDGVPRFPVAHGIREDK